MSPQSHTDALFQALRERFGGRIELVYQRLSDSDRPWKSLDARSLRQQSYSAIFRRLVSDERLVIVSAGWRGRIRLALLAMAILLRRPLIIWTDTPANTASFKHRLRNYMLGLLFRRSHAVMGTGELALETLRQMGVPESKLVNFPYWISIGEEMGAPVGSRLPFRFACIGRLVAYKGFHYAIEALAELNNTVAELDIIGTGREEATLRQLAKSLGIEHRVNFLGWLEPHEVREYLRTRCCCLTHPSERLEPYGVVVIEAMAHGLPVIGSDRCGAVVDRVKNGWNGYVLPSPVTSTHLAEYMQQLLADKNLGCAFGKNARITAERWPLERALKIVSDISAAAY